MQISNINPTELHEFSRNLLIKYRDSCSSFEEAAQLIVEDFYNLFQSSAGEPEFGLVRIFRTTRFNQLSPELKAKKIRTSRHFLALMGTVGIEEAWCSRHESHFRQAIPINQDMSPMFKGVFQELGFSWNDTTEDTRVTGQGLDSMNAIRFFYVEDVSASSYITDQEQFVQPYNIQSVFAIGTQFVSKESFVFISFSTQPIHPEQVELLVAIAPFVASVLASFDAKNALWTD